MTRSATATSPQLFLEKKPFGAITRDDLLDNITLYWLTITACVIGVAVLGEWQGSRGCRWQADAGRRRPCRLLGLPEEIVGAPKSWLERAYPKLAYYNKLDKGGHFAAWEEPELFATELRAAFKSLR